MVILRAGNETATSADQSITPETPFSSVSLINSGSNLINFAIGETVTDATTAARVIALPGGASFSMDLRGDRLSYQAASNTTFSYVLATA
ncbi:MAG: hypothetical protein AAF267_20180 [Deinococcota bacterium]